MPISAGELVSKFRYALENGWGYIWGTAGIVWTKARQDAASREMTVKYGSKWIGHNVADCSGLFVWAFRQLGGSIYHGSNTIYRSYCSARGKMDGRSLRTGTAVFTGTENDHGHIGLYVGDGTVIEAKGTQAGVVTSKVTDKKWTYWGELKDVQYDGDPEPSGKPTLRKGDSGPYVTLAQTELIQRGYDLGSWGADGKFGAQTEKAVKQFQTDWGLTADGVIGPKTWEMLEETPVKVTYRVTVPNLSLREADELVSKYPGAVMKKEGAD